jgi:uncharacterized protein (DUF433 family)
MIESVPGVCGGDPVIKGTRITCGFLYRLHDKLAASVRLIHEMYPQLSHQEIKEAIAYAKCHPEECQTEGDE